MSNEQAFDAVDARSSVGQANDVKTGRLPSRGSQLALGEPCHQIADHVHNDAIDDG